MKILLKANTLVLLLIVLLAVFFRFYQLDKTPPGLYPDVAINGNDALTSLQTGDFKLFYPENNGREGLIMWLDALSIYLFGITILALKIPAAVIGTLTVLGVYLLARILFKERGDAIALLAAFFTAVSFWHVNFSRIGFRAILVPFCLVFSFYFLWRGFKEKNFLLALISGIFFGLGFYTYTVFRLAVPFLFCVLAVWSIFFWRDKKIFFKISAAMLLAVFFAALPIGIYFLQHPADFFGRSGQTAVFATGNPLLSFVVSLGLHLQMFNFFGDWNWRHNYSGAPELFWPLGILFLVGLAISLRRLFSKKCIGETYVSYATLLLWFLFMLLPEALTFEGVPHALRAIGVIPAVMIISAIGGVWAYDWLRPRTSKMALMSISIIFVAIIVIQGYWQYFIAWAQNPNVQEAFTVRYVDVANLAVSFPAGYQTVIIVNEDGVPVPYPDGIPMPAQTVIFAETAHCYKSYCLIDKTWYSPHSAYLKPDQLDQIVCRRKTVVIPMKNEQTIFDQLSQICPQGQIKSQNNITYYEINR